MAGIIERIAKNPATILQRTGITDGKPVWSEISCLCFPFDFEQSDKEYFGAIQDGKIFMVAPLELDTPPELPGRIVYDGIEYDIRGIRTYRNLKGVCMGYRIAVAGAS